MRKLILVYSPRSSQYGAIQDEVIDAARRITGFVVTKFLVKEVAVGQNVRLLATLLEDGDLVVAAGGDGTATVAINAVMVAGKDVAVGVLGYGNFNDVAEMLARQTNGKKASAQQSGINDLVQRFIEGRTREIYPLEVKVDGVLWRFVPAYLTIGLLAESTTVFDEEDVRQKMGEKKRRRGYSMRMLARWYFKNRQAKRFLPDAQLNGAKIRAGATDYLAVNAPRVAGIMKSEPCYQDKKKFLSGCWKLDRISGLASFMAKSLTRGMPLEATEKDVLEFSEPTEIGIQSEGEYERTRAQKIEIAKGKALKVV